MSETDSTDDTNPAPARTRKRRTTDTFRKLVSDDPLSETIFDSGTDETVSTDTIYESTEPTPESSYPEDKDGKRPDRKAVRTSGADFLSSGVIAIGTVLVSRRIDPPVGRVLQLGSPLYGNKIDEAIADTFLDRVLQPLFRKGDQLNDLGALLAVPVCVAVLERKPETAPFLEGILMDALGTMLEETAPLMTKKRAKQRRAARSMTDINESFNIPRGADPVKYIIENFLFGDYQNVEGEDDKAEG